MAPTIPTAKRYRLTAGDDPHGEGVKCNWCKHPRYAGDDMFRVAKPEGDELYCSTTCKTFMYGAKPKGGRR
jgi:hypothetical protein